MTDLLQSISVLCIVAMNILLGIRVSRLERIMTKIVEAETLSITITALNNALGVKPKQP